MKKTAFVILVGLMWIQVPHYLSFKLAEPGAQPVVGGLAAGLVQDVLLFAVAAAVLALVFHLSNIERFSRRDVALAVAPMMLMGLVGLFLFSRDVAGWILLYQVLATGIEFLVPVMVVPLYLELFRRLENRQKSA